MLTGHNATTTKDTAEVVLNTDEGWPLLAQWHYGLGRVVAWTSDVGGRWTSNWLSWEQNNLFWAQLVRWAMGPPIDRDIRIAISRSGNEARVTVEDVIDGKFADLQPLTLTVSAPGGGSSRVLLRQVAAGQYEASVIVDTPGVYEVDVAEPSELRKPGRTATNSLVVPPL